MTSAVPLTVLTVELSSWLSGAKKEKTVIKLLDLRTENYKLEDYLTGYYDNEP